jgi:3-oxoacyl-[acyl-carrier-protein] synthase III
MRLDSVKLVLPSRGLTNDEVVALVREQSAAVYRGDLERLVARVGALLHRSGAVHRYWLAPGEETLTLVARAVQQAVDAAGCGIADVDLLICAGVDRGFVEPANAYLIAQALDLGRVACFDVVDACNGWTRAIQLLFALFRTGAYRRALIINSEFPMFDGGPIYPRLFGLRDRKELAWSFAGYTLGEGVTATVLSAVSDGDWEFHGSSRPDLADLSTLPLPGYERYRRASARIARNGVGQFAAFSGAMFAEAIGEVGRLFERLKVPTNEIRAIFPHGATRRSWDQGARWLGVRHLMYHTYPRYGNLVSASIPAGLATAIDNGELRRGDRVVICGASAGMSFSASSFRY